MMSFTHGWRTFILHPPDLNLELKVPTTAAITTTITTTTPALTTGRSWHPDLITRLPDSCKFDLVFIIDGSSSVGDENFRKTKDFMRSLGND